MLDISRVNNNTNVLYRDCKFTSTDLFSNPIFPKGSHVSKCKINFKQKFSKHLTLIFEGFNVLSHGMIRHVAIVGDHKISSI